MPIKLLTEEEYSIAMQRVEALMQDGEAKLTEKEMNELKLLAEECEYYEDKKWPIDGFLSKQMSASPWIQRFQFNKFMKASPQTNGGTITSLEQLKENKAIIANPGMLDAVYEGAAQWEERCRAAEAIIKQLLVLKLNKDVFGKTPEYEEQKLIAWDKARIHCEMFHISIL